MEGRAVLSSPEEDRLCIRSCLEAAAATAAAAAAAAYAVSCWEIEVCSRTIDKTGV
jgi:hypothetical protein